MPGIVCLIRKLIKLFFGAIEQIVFVLRRPQVGSKLEELALKSNPRKIIKNLEIVPAEESKNYQGAKSQEKLKIQNLKLYATIIAHYLFFILIYAVIPLNKISSIML